MATFTLATGLRASNVSGLTWEQVDLERRLAWVHPDEAKSRKAIAVPLNATAMRVLRAQVGHHSEHVFTYDGKPVKQLSTKAWYKALARAGIKNFRWHDLRDTWASWHVQNGTPLFALQELAGWETERMARRYAHFAASHLAVYAANVESRSTVTTRPSDFRGTPNSNLLKTLGAEDVGHPDTRIFNRSRWLQGLMKSTACSACEPRPRAYQGTITAYPI
jgi:hypothetical protein